jgi:hypothetical protein
MDAFSIACEDLGALQPECIRIPDGNNLLLRAAWPDQLVDRTILSPGIDLLMPAEGTRVPWTLGASITITETGDTFHLPTSTGPIRSGQLAPRVKEALDAQARILAQVELLAGNRLSEDDSKALLTGLFLRGFGLEMQEVLTPAMHKELTTLNGSFEEALLMQGITWWGLFAGMLQFTNRRARRRSPRHTYIMAGKGCRLNMVFFDVLNEHAARCTATVLQY